MDYEGFLGCMTILADVTNKRLSDGLYEVWWRTFGLYPLETFATAIDLAAAECEFFPTPAAFTAIIDRLLTPEERGIQEGIRLMRSWVSHGALPPCRDADELAAIKAALGLPPPTAVEIARVAAHRAELRRAVEADGGDWAAHEALPPGPVVARLLGVDRLALASGR